MNAASGLSLLLRASLEGGALVLLVAVVTRLGHRLPAWSRALLWWAACLKLVLACFALPAVPLHLPAPAVISARPIAPVARTVARWESRADGAVRDVAQAPPGTAAPSPLRWLGPALLALWAAGATGRAALLLRESRRLERAWRDASSWDGARHAPWLADALGALAPHCELRIGEAFTTPLVLAGPRGRVLLPASFVALPAADQRAVLAHEVAHLKRGDLTWGAVVALAETLFWFHPLARWAAHEYALAREEACDADALRLSGAEPHHYGELLLAFGLENCSPRHAGASYGSRHFRHLRRRLVMLGFASRPTRTQAVLAAVAIAAVLGALVPYRLVSARPGNAEAPRAESSTSTEVWVDAGDADASRPNALPFAFGVLEGGHTFLYGSFNRAQQADVEEARERSGDVRTLWFRLHDRTYTSTDARLLHEVGETLEPLTSMSSSQARLGSAQGSLGEQQGAIGQREAELAHRQARLEQAIGELEESLAETRESGPKVREIRARIAKLQSEVDAIEASTQALESQVGDLDRAQDSLGVMQDKLQNRLDEISPAVVRQIRKLSEEAIADGRAVRQR